MKPVFIVVLSVLLLSGCGEKRNLSHEEALKVAANMYGNFPAAIDAANWCKDVDDKGGVTVKRELLAQFRKHIVGESEEYLYGVFVLRSSYLGGWVDNLLVPANLRPETREFLNRCVEETQRMVHK